MPNNLDEKMEAEPIHIRYAFWLTIFGLVLTAGVLIFLVVYKNHKVDEPAELVAIIGVFTSLICTSVGILIGVHVGSSGVEHERSSRRRAEKITRIALAHLHPDTHKELLATIEQQL